MSHGKYYKIVSAEKTHDAWHYITVQLEGYEETYPVWCGANTYTLTGGNVDEEKMVEIKLEGKCYFVPLGDLEAFLYRANDFLVSWLTEHKTIQFELPESDASIEDMTAQLHGWIDLIAQRREQKKVIEGLRLFLREES